jgi:predicted phosphodiesterase
LSFSLSRNNNNANEMEAHLNDETFLSLDQKGAKSHNDLLQITMVIGEYLCVLHKLNAGFKPLNMKFLKLFPKSTDPEIIMESHTHNLNYTVRNKCLISCLKAIICVSQ